MWQHTTGVLFSLSRKSLINISMFLNTLTKNNNKYQHAHLDPKSLWYLNPVSIYQYLFCELFQLFFSLHKQTEFVIFLIWWQFEDWPIVFCEVRNSNTMIIQQWCEIFLQKLTYIYPHWNICIQFFVIFMIFICEI